MVAVSPLIFSSFVGLLLGGLRSDDGVLDLVVDVLGQDAAGDELVLGGVGAAVDDALGVGIADAGEGLQLVRGRCVDVELVVWSGGGGGGGLGFLRDGCGREGQREEECQGAAV